MIRRFTPLSAKPGHRDPVTPIVRATVLDRDRGCVAPRLGATDSCRGRATLDHVKAEPMMGKRAPSRPESLVTLCEWHHLYGWATAHRPELRTYLREVEGWTP